MKKLVIFIIVLLCLSPEAVGQVTIDGSRGATSSVSSTVDTLISSEANPDAKLYRSSANMWYTPDSLTTAGLEVVDYVEFDTTLRNTELGYTAGNAITTGTDNTAVGHEALLVGTGNYNTAIGQAALYSQTTESLCTAVGHQAGHANVTGTALAAFGASAGYSSTGDNNTYLGTEAGYYPTTGASNTYVGAAAGRGILGADGGFNVAVGHQALSEHDGSGSTVAIGYASLQRSISANQQTSLGAYSGFYNETGHLNTLVGYYAGYGSSGNSHDQNTFVGARAGVAITTGDNNIAIGLRAADELTTGSNNIIIGYDIDAPAVGSDNTLNIGNLLFATGLDGADGTLSSGNFGVGVKAPSTKFEIFLADTVTKSVVDILTLSHTGGTVVAGFGSGISFRLEDAGGAEKQAGIHVEMTTVTDASEDVDLVQTVNSGGDLIEATRAVGWQGSTYFVVGGQEAGQALQALTVESLGPNTDVVGVSQDTSQNLLVLLSASSGNAGFIALRDHNNVNKINLLADGDSYFNAGNFGVGDTSPDYPLEILSATTPQFAISNDDGNDYFTIGVTPAGLTTFTTVDQAAALGHIALMPDGNVGIGTTAPQYMAQIDGSDGALLVVDSDINIDRSSAAEAIDTSAVYLYTQGNGNARVDIVSESGSTSFLEGASNGLTIDFPSGFDLKRAGSARLRIESTVAYFSSVNVGIGTATPDSGLLTIATGVGTYDLYLGQTSPFSKATAGAGWVTSSDSALKRDIVLLDSLIDRATLVQKFLAVRPVRFRWNPDSIFVAFNSGNFSGYDTLAVAQQDSVRSDYIQRETIRTENIGERNNFGFLGQEFADQFGGKPTEIDQDRMRVVQWQMIQELTTELIALRQRVQTLEGLH